MLQASSLALIGMLTVVGCGGSDTPSTTKKNDGGPDGAGIPTNPAAVLKVDKVLVPFGTVDVGAKSAAPLPTVTVTNTSRTEPASLAPMVTGAGFAIETTTCGATLAAAQSCVITLSFAPTTVGNASGSLIIVTGMSVSLNGQGVAPGTFTVTDRVDLGTVAAGAAVPVAVRVTATAALTGLSCLGNGADLVADPASTTCTSSIAANVPCVFGFTFRSATAGVKSDSVICAAGLTVKTVPVSATVVTPPAITISPAAATVTSTVGVPSNAVLVVANSGGSTTGALRATVAPATEFALVSECVVPLESLKTCKLTVVFTPASAGSKTATVTVVDTTAATVTATATVTGVANTPSNLTLTGAADFGSVALGTAGTPVTYTIRNTGGLPAAAVTIASTESQFKIASDTCTGTTLAATTGSCTFTVTFAPAATAIPGLINGLLTANSDAGLPVSVAIRGTAITPPTLSLSPNPLAFDGIALNTQSGDKVLTVTNTGAAETGAITVPAGLGNGFVISGNTCSASLAPAQTCTIAIRFTPSAIAQATFTITVASASGSTGSATLTGTGRQPNVLDISPRDVKGCSQEGAASTCFKETALGQTNGSFPLTPGADPIRFIITNTNTASAGGINLESGVVTVTIGGAAATDFVAAGTNCGPSLAPGQTCYYDVSFTATAAGDRAGVISVTSANGGNVATNMNAVGLPALEIQPCGYWSSAPDHHTPGPALSDAVAQKKACVDRLKNNVDGTNDRTGLDFGQLPLGANCETAVKLLLVTVNSSTSADYLNLITSVVTDAATPANFQIQPNGTGGATVAGIGNCNNQKLDTSRAAAQCWLPVKFWPQGTAEGAKTATIGSTGSGGGSASVTVTGRATGALAINPAAAEFGTVIVNESGAGSTDVTMRVYNWSNYDVGPGVSVAVTGEAAGDFRKLADTCTRGATATENMLPAQSGSACSLETPSCTVTYRFFPAAVGSRTATFTVTAGTQSSTATMHGTGVPETTISAAPAALAFPNTVISKKSEWQTVTVTAGAGAYETGAIKYSIVGDNIDQFEYPSQDVDLGTCGRSESTRLGGSNPASCTIKVRFIPGKTNGLGLKKAFLLVSDPRDRTLDQKIALTGTGTTALTISPTSGDFGAVQIDESVTTALTFTVTNIGDVSIAAPTVTYDVTHDQKYFAAGALSSNACGDAALPVGGTCLIAVVLGDHTKAGVFTSNIGVKVEGQGGDNQSSAAASLSVTVDSKAHLDLVDISGVEMVSGAEGGALDLGSASTGQTGGQATLLVRNTGGHPTGPINYTFFGDRKANIGTAYSENTPADNFSLVPPASETDPDNCLSNVYKTNGLAGGRFCKLTVRFTPAISGSFTAGLEVSAKYSAEKPWVAVKGEGLASANKLTIAPAFYSFYAAGAHGPVTFSITAADDPELAAQTATAFTIVNSGDPATVTFTGTNLASIQDIATSSADFYWMNNTTASSCLASEGSKTLGAGATCYVWIKFAPKANDPVYRSGALSVTVGATTHTVGMVGKVREGTKLQIWSPATGTDFGSVVKQTNSAAKTFTVMNVGDAATTGNTTLGITGAGAKTRYSATGCGSAAGVLAAFNPATPSTIATCVASVVVNPGSAALGPLATPVFVEATYSGTSTANGTLNNEKATNQSLPADLPDSATLKTDTINPAALTVEPSSTQTFTDIQAVGTKSAARTITITNGPSVRDPALGGERDTATTSKVTVVLTEGSAASTNFILNLNPDGAGSDACQAKADQITGDLILLGNESCVVSVTFAPLAMPAEGTAFAATLTASAENAISAGTVSFAATGRNPLRVSKVGDTDRPESATAPYAFAGSTARGQLSAPIVFTIQMAPGGEASGLLSTTVTGDYHVAADTCQGVSVAAGATCTVTLQFQPTATGARTGSLTVSGVPGGSATIGLTGTGT